MASPQAAPRPDLLEPLREVRLTSAFLGGPILRTTKNDFALQTEKPPRVGEIYPCELYLGDRKVILKGRVDWCLLKRMEKQTNGDVVPIYYAGITVGEDDLETYRRALAAEGKKQADVVS